MFKSLQHTAAGSYYSEPLQTAGNVFKTEAEQPVMNVGDLEVICRRTSSRFSFRHGQKSQAEHRTTQEIMDM